MKKNYFLTKWVMFSPVITGICLLVFSSMAYSQCLVQNSVNASTLTQGGVVPFTNCNNLITIGDGVNPAVILMDAELNLTSLGPVIITSKAFSGFDFSPGNQTLLLAAGSILIFEDNAVLIGGSCNASERILIGDVKMASCNGQAGFEYSFADLLNNGGFGVVNLSAGQPNCSTNSVELFAAPFPPDDVVVSWYDAPTGGNLIGEGLTLTSDLSSGNTTVYAEASFTSLAFSSTREPIEQPQVQTAIWDGNSWQNTAPDENVNVTFQSALTTTGNLSACNLAINSGNVVVNPGHTLKVLNNVTVAGGSLTFENNASLVQVNDLATNSGPIIYKRNTTPMERFDFTYWSSPVSGQTLFNLSPETLSDKYFYWDSPSQRWVTIFNGQAIMNPGTGYIIRSPQSYTVGNRQIYNGQFSGVPHNGRFEVNVSKPLPLSFALLGNPYPSAMNADTFILQNQAVLQGSLYFWTHNTPITNLQFTSNDYAVYNLTGGTRAISGGEIPDGNIPAGQGFFVDLATSGTVVFNNAQRAIGGNDRFFEANKPKDVSISLSTSSSTQTELTNLDNSAYPKSRLWLNLTSSQGYFSQLLLAYVDAATNEKDHLWDALYLNGGQNPIGFYSHINDEKFTINAQSNQTAAKFLLGYTSKLNTEFTIALEKGDGFFENIESIYLKDLATGIEHNLKKSPYTFIGTKGDFDKRFELSFVPEALNADVLEVPEVSISTVRDATGLQLISEGSAIQAVSVFNFSGIRLMHRSKIGKYSVTLPNMNQAANTFLIVEVELENGYKQTLKIVL